MLLVLNNYNYYYYISSVHIFLLVILAPTFNPHLKNRTCLGLFALLK